MRAQLFQLLPRDATRLWQMANSLKKSAQSISNKGRRTGSRRMQTRGSRGKHTRVRGRVERSSCLMHIPIYKKSRNTTNSRALATVVTSNTFYTTTSARSGCPCAQLLPTAWATPQSFVGDQLSVRRYRCNRDPMFSACPRPQFPLNFFGRDWDRPPCFCFSLRFKDRHEGRQHGKSPVFSMPGVGQHLRELFRARLFPSGASRLFSAHFFLEHALCRSGDFVLCTFRTFWSRYPAAQGCTSARFLKPAFSPSGATQHFCTNSEPLSRASFEHRGSDTHELQSTRLSLRAQTFCTVTSYPSRP